jgi:hypothetical protein
MKIAKTTILAGFLAGTLLLPTIPAMADPHREFHVPPGHMPPPGSCRIWFPGRPPGHQPAPGSCRVLSRQVPLGAYLIANDNHRWNHAELNHRHFRHDIFDGPRYSTRREIRQDIRDVRQARKDVREDREQLQKNRDELIKDRVELKKDLHSGASRKEIAQDRREIRQDLQKVNQNKRDLRESQDRLQSAREELRDDLRRR